MKERSPIYILRRKNTLFLLEHLNMSRYELSDRSGIGYSLLSGYLRERNYKGLGNLNASKIEKAFGLEKGALDRDLKAELDSSDGSSTPKEAKELREQNKKKKLERNSLEQKVLSVPLFIISSGTGRLSLEKEPYLEEAYIKISDVYYQNVQPKHVKAFKVFSNVENIPDKATVFLDSSVDSVDVSDALYLTCMNNERKVMKLTSQEEAQGMLILGRLFHVEYSLN